MSWNIFLILLSVLNTYSLPTISLLNYIQAWAGSECPNLGNKLRSCYGELDYLKSCELFDPNSSNAQDIRCNLYLNQFNLLCESALSVEPEVCLTREYFEKALNINKVTNVLNDTCSVFARPLMVAKTSDIDDFVVRKCRWICTDIRTDKIDMLCVAASYFRMLVLENEQVVSRNAQQLVNNAHNPDRMDSSTLPKQLPPILQQSSNKSAKNQEDITNNIPISRNFDESGNGGVAVVSSVGATGDAKLETAPQLSEHDGTVKNTESANTVQKNDNDAIPSKINGNVGDGVKDKTDVGYQTSSSEYTQENTLANSKPIFNDEIVNTNAVKPNVSIPLVESKSTEKATTSRQVAVDSSSTAFVKNDKIIDADDLSPQNTAQQSDYSDGKESENHLANVKHPGMTENEDDTINQNLYRDVSTVQDDSYFFTYFMMLCVVFIFAYVGYHNKQKIIAIVVEGRRGSSGGGRGGRSRAGRRPNSSNYHKLDSNLEEAVSSNTTNKNTSKVIY